MGDPSRGARTRVEAIEGLGLGADGNTGLGSSMIAEAS